MNLVKLRKKLKANRFAVWGWVLAAVFLGLWVARPRVKIVETTEWRETTTADSTLVADKDAKATVDKDGTVTIEGGFTLESSTRSTSEGSMSKTTTPVAWTGRIGVSVLVPPPCKLHELRKQLEADWRVGSLFGLDVGMGGRVVFPATSFVPEFYGVGLSITF